MKIVTPKEFMLIKQEQQNKANKKFDKRFNKITDKIILKLNQGLLSGNRILYIDVYKNRNFLHFLDLAKTKDQKKKIYQKISTPFVESGWRLSFIDDYPITFKLISDEII